MPDRTETSHLSSISLSLPTGPVTFHFPNSDLSKSLGKHNHCILAIPSKSTWGPGPHWHEAYTEHVQVLKGKAKVTINGVSRIVEPDDGMLTFERYVIHDFCAARVDGEDGDEEVWVEEWTDPEDGFKEVFFYNVMSTFVDYKKFGMLSTAIQLLIIIQYVDNYVAILPHWMPFRLNFWLCHSFYAIGRMLGAAMGYRTWYEEYTPKQYWEVARRGGEGGKKKV